MFINFIRTFDYYQNNKAAGDTDQCGVKYQENYIYVILQKSRWDEREKERERREEEGVVEGENGSWDWGEDLISLCSLFFGITFLQAKIC